MLFFVGTYTRLGGPGIASCSLEEGRLTLLQSTTLSNPTYMILSPDQKRLYAVSSNATDETPGGSYAAFDLVGSQLVLRHRFNTDAVGPCHLCLSPDGRFLYTAQYNSGTLSVFPLDPPGPCIQLIRHSGQSLHPTRQEGPHAHQVSFIPGTRRLTVVDLGIDALVFYDQDPLSGQLTEADRWSCQPGLGPRHLVYSQENRIYLLHELGNAVSYLRMDGPEIAHLQTITTLPPDWQGENTTAAIRTNGRYVFTSNRGHDSIAVFRTWAGGRLQQVGYFPCGGHLPRDFFLLPDRHMLVANQGGTVTLLFWDQENETIRTTGQSLDLPGAVCICPLI